MNLVPCHQMLNMKSLVIRFPRWFFLTLLFAIGGTGCTHEPTSKSGVERLFTKALGFPPPATAVNLAGKSYEVRGDYIAWFMFSNQEATVREIVNHHFQKAGNKELNGEIRRIWVADFHDAPNPNAPRWWPRSGPEQNDEIYYCDPRGPTSNDYQFLWIRKASNTVYLGVGYSD